METRTIGEIIGIIVLMISLGVNVADVNDGSYIMNDVDYKPYSCDVADDMFCHKLSKINSDGIQRNCYYNKESSRRYKVCSTGWESIQIKISNTKSAKQEICPVGQPCYKLEV